MRTVWLLPVVALMTACASTSTDAPETSKNDTRMAKAYCYEDTPTGTRFGKTICLTPAQQKAKAEEEQQAGEDARRIRNGSNLDRR